MKNLSLLDDYFKKYSKELPKWAPDGVISVDLKLLDELQLLRYYYGESSEDIRLTSYFHAIETAEKITLINDRFVIWIVPFFVENNPTTFTFIAKINEETPLLELIFSTSETFNTSRLVLRILEKFINEIEENEDLLRKLK
jgi:hypothetical protein